MEDNGSLLLALGRLRQEDCYSRFWASLGYKATIARWLWYTPLILALQRQRQVDLCKFKASLIYRVSSRRARGTQRNPVLKNQNKMKRKTSTKNNDKKEQINSL